MSDKNEDEKGSEKYESPIERYIKEIHKLFKINSKIIAAAFSEKENILYSTDNWNIKPDIKNIISNWRTEKNQFIIISGTKYSILQLGPDRLIAFSKGLQGCIVAASNNIYYLFLYVSPGGDVTSTAIDTQKTFGNLMKLPYFEKNEEDEEEDDGKS